MMAFASQAHGSISPLHLDNVGDFAPSSGAT